MAETKTKADISLPNVAVYNTDATDTDGNSQLQLNPKNGMIAPRAKAKIRIKFLNPLRLAFKYSVGVSGISMNAANMAEVKVNAYNYSGDENNPIGQSAGKGVSIIVNGVAMAVTNTSGTAKITKVFQFLLLTIYF